MDINKVIEQEKCLYIRILNEENPYEKAKLMDEWEKIYFKLQSMMQETSSIEFGFVLKSVELN